MRLQKKKMVIKLLCCQDWKQLKIVVSTKMIWSCSLHHFWQVYDHPRSEGQQDISQHNSLSGGEFSKNRWKIVLAQPNSKDKMPGSFQVMNLRSSRHFRWVCNISCHWAQHPSCSLFWVTQAWRRNFKRWCSQTPTRRWKGSVVRSSCWRRHLKQI